MTEPRHGRRALLVAAVAVAVATAGCGQDQQEGRSAVVVERTSISTVAPAAPEGDSPKARPSTGVRYRSGRVRQLVPLPKPRAELASAPAAALEPSPAPAPERTRRDPAAFRRSHLAALKAYCATGPRDPRCDGNRVDVRLALTGLEATR